MSTGMEKKVARAIQKEFYLNYTSSLSFAREETVRERASNIKAGSPSLPFREAWIQATREFLKAHPEEIEEASNERGEDHRDQGNRT